VPLLAPEPLLAAAAPPEPAALELVPVLVLGALSEALAIAAPAMTAPAAATEAAMALTFEMAMQFS